MKKNMSSGYSGMLTRTFSVKKTMDNFSGIAWFYDTWGKLTERKAINEAIKLSDLENNSLVLDVGVGTGQLFNKIIERNTSGFNSGVDLSPGMLKKSNKKFTNKSIYVSLVNGNAYHLPYKNNLFDFLFCSYVIDLLPEEDFGLILTEFRRVMRDKGTGVIISMSMGERWYNKFWYVLAKYFPSLLTNCRPVELSVYLEKAKFSILDKQFFSQNTFPSEVIKFSK